MKDKIITGVIENPETGEKFVRSKNGNSYLI